ncbi:hypothetical protein H9P43_003960 [Blastocladiella emersonii ATCC 22665]|nr:hypothetical protein H9P43_003960 [Blastocladiella emersonii ATCC 22665]
MTDVARPKSPVATAAAPKSPVLAATAAPAAAAAATNGEKAPRKRAPRKNAQREPRDPAEESRKAFVGNIPFTVLEEDLTTHFAPAGTIERALVVRKAGRHVGFGFVIFADAASVAKAVAQFDGTTMGDRQIAVQAVIPKPAAAERPRRAPRHEGEAGEEGAEKAAPKPRAPRAPRQPRAEGDAPADAAAAPRQRNQRRSPVAAAEGAEGAAAPAAGSAKPKRQRNKRPAGSAANGNGESAAPREPRAPRAKRIVDITKEGTPMPTTVYVANLGESVDDAALAAAFTAKGFSVVKAYIISKRDGKRRFAFVELESAAEQARAVAELQGADFGGKPVTVQVAMAKPPRVEDEAEGTAGGAAPWTA